MAVFLQAGKITWEKVHFHFPQSLISPYLYLTKYYLMKRPMEIIAVILVTILLAATCLRCNSERKDREKGLAAYHSGK
ncbi:hypothetical protein [Chitinophaga vietnamensis]|uniref:hypothetical protein n=1 Tax=Chitinophaga vietnamensis TaxID=2593957 RepID=UPI00117883E7|nr:hypothetical protein [Chitinophaga vietnamensis]